MNVVAFVGSNPASLKEFLNSQGAWVCPKKVFPCLVSEVHTETGPKWALVVEGRGTL